MMIHYILPVAPTLEMGPVVASYQQRELAIRIVLAQVLQGVPGIRGFGQTELIVAGLHALNTLKGFLCHLQAQTVVQQIGIISFQRILWRHHQPYLI